MNEERQAFDKELVAKELRIIWALSTRQPPHFSCNAKGEIWVPGRGYTPEASRVYVHGRSRLLDRIADYVIRFQEEGGRFYVSEQGVFMADGDALVLRPAEMARLLEH